MKELASFDDGDMDHVESDSDPDFWNETKNTELIQFDVSCYWISAMGNRK